MMTDLKIAAKMLAFLVGSSSPAMAGELRILFEGQIAQQALTFGKVAAMT
jgi:hypothetical protein